MDGSEQFCGSKLWDSNLTWNTDFPDFTPCMRSILRDWPACAFLVLSLPFYILYLKKRKATRLKHFCAPKRLVIPRLKMMFGCLTAVCIAVEFIIGLSHSSSGIDLVSFSTQFISLVLSVVLISVYRKHGYYTSGPLYFYWLFMLFGYTTHFYVSLRDVVTGAPPNPLQSASTSLIHLILAGLEALFIVISFILACISDADQHARSHLQETASEWWCSFNSILSFDWMTQLMKRGYSKPLDDDDVWNLVPTDQLSAYEGDFRKYWFAKLDNWNKAKEKSKTASSTSNDDETTPLIRSPSHDAPVKDPPLSLANSLFYHWWPSILLGLVLNYFNAILQFVKPSLLKLVIQLVESKSVSPETLWKGVLISLAFFLLMIIITYNYNCVLWVNNITYLQVRACLATAVYRKALKMGSASRSDSTTGEIVNLMQVDTTRVSRLFNYTWMISATPFRLGLSLYLLYNLLGHCVFYGIALLCVSIPLTWLNSYVRTKIQNRLMAVKDERVKLINEVLAGIKVVKMYGWEPSFEKKVDVLRAKEVQYIKYINLMLSFSAFIYFCLPVFVTVLILTLYVRQTPDHVLTPSTAFVALEYLRLARNPIIQIPQFISYAIECNVSLKRLTTFFKTPDLLPAPFLPMTPDSTSEQPPVELSHTTLGWKEEEPPLLNDISLTVPRGALHVIVGRVGSGKSSLLAAMTGELHKYGGNAHIRGRVAIVTQQAWIYNGTVKDNILFGSDFDEQRYKTVVEACALTSDFRVLAAGDNTRIGEQGINLSGGQKQRVSLARAVYNDADIYLLDDPLSAVDSHVGKHLFEHVIGSGGLLKQKTVIMATHGRQWLPDADYIYMMKNQRIMYRGTYNDLINIPDFNLLMDNEEEDKEDGSSGETDLENKTKKVSRMEKDHEPESSGEDEEMDESVETTNVSAKVYLYYIKAVGCVPALCTLIGCVVSMVSDTLSGIWLSMWTGDTDFDNLNNTAALSARSEYYIDGYSIFCSLNGFGLLFCNVSAAYCSYRASKVLHRILFLRIVHAKASFFDVKPVGMLLNRFSKDMEVVDNDLGRVIMWTLYTVIEIGTNLSGVGYSASYLVLVFIPIGFIFLLIQRYFIRSARQLRRLSSRSATPVYVQFTESLKGSQTIRAYRYQDYMIEQLEEKLNKMNKYEYLTECCNRWLDIRMNIVTGVLVALTALFCVGSTQIPYLASLISASKAGLSVSLVLNAAYAMHDLTWLVSRLETNLISVERIREYSEVEQEADFDCPNPHTPDWPAEGEVKFKDYYTRYRPGLNLVLHGINVHIKPNEKIGVVGRTGAGKSSLTQALFRLIEAESGSINVDGIDISTLGLKHVRNGITILPQDPLLFCGSVRENLDPFGKFDDNQLWKSLDKSSLGDFMREKNEGLDFQCGESGSNLSVGQRQLMCLARALLRRNKILILDEATAAVDMQTDQCVQETIKSDFSHCTVITIAHRLNTIIDSDRILVLDQGHIVEFDTPQTLLSKQGGYFRSLAEEAGLVTMGTDSSANNSFSIN